MSEGSRICDVVGCDEKAVFYTEVDNVLCEDCMEKDMVEKGNLPEDYETIESVNTAINAKARDADHAEEIDKEIKRISEEGVWP